MDTQQPQIKPKSRWGHGKLRLPINATVYGGRYYEAPAKDVPGFTRVKMAKEIGLPCDIDIPTVDFHVPPRELMQRGLRKMVLALIRGDQLYIGCMGGVGRTGLAMALLVKVLGSDNPVAVVRESYKAHAVETSKQMEYVHTFKPWLSTRVLALYLRIKRRRTA